MAEVRSKGLLLPLIFIVKSYKRPLLKKPQSSRGKLICISHPPSGKQPSELIRSIILLRINNLLSGNISVFQSKLLLNGNM